MFKAIRVWFIRFEDRSYLHKTNEHNEVASADIETAIHLGDIAKTMYEIGCPNSCLL